jgi:hypothetical protein
MANKKEEKAATPAEELLARFRSGEPLSIEEMELATRHIALQTAMLQMDEVEEANRKRIEKRAAVARFNKQLQEDVRAEQAALESGQKICRHRSGGFPNNIYRGNKEPTVFRTRMPDGYTYFIQCIRCRFKMYTPHPKLEDKNPKEYARQMEIYERMWELCEERALDEIRTPSFTWRKHGVEFVPERV